MSVRRLLRVVAGAATIAALGACAMFPAQPDVADFDVAAAVVLIRAAGSAGNAELEVQPLRNPEVEDLREQAQQRQQRGDHRAAAQLLDQAIGLHPDDPMLLQERAEAALLLRDLAGAEATARHAWQIGTRVGPLCRRHWETVVQIAQARRDAELAMATRRRSAQPVDGGARAALDEARRQRDACTVNAPPRY